MRYTIHAAIDGHGPRQHTIKAETQDEALARLRRAYSGRGITQIRIIKQPDLEATQ